MTSNNTGQNDKPLPLPPQAIYQPFFTITRSPYGYHIGFDRQRLHDGSLLGHTRLRWKRTNEGRTKYVLRDHPNHSESGPDRTQEGKTVAGVELFTEYGCGDLPKAIGISVHRRDGTNLIKEGETKRYAIIVDDENLTIHFTPAVFDVLPVVVPEVVNGHVEPKPELEAEPKPVVPGQRAEVMLEVAQAIEEHHKKTRVFKRAVRKKVAITEDDGSGYVDEV